MKSDKIKDFKNSANLETLRDWCLTICDFIKSEFPDQNLDMSITNLIVCSINDIYQKQSLMKMRAVFKETNIMFGEEALSTEQMGRLNQILKEKFGHSLADESDKETAQIEKIIKRGKIRNDREFELVKRREDMVYVDDSQREYMLALQKLMSDYEFPENN